MRRAVLATCAAVLLAAPALLAPASGGYGDEARLVAGVSAWLLAAAGALAAPRPLPRSTAGRVALGGLAALAALTLASVLWAPLAAPAYADAQRLALYLGVLVAAVAILPAARALRAVEPALAACAVVVVGYGLSERLAPWLVTLTRSAAAGGRLNQPLGYWNAMGAVAAIGLVLVAALAGDARRTPRARALAAAAGPLLGAGVALSFSRGALLAAAVGLGVTLLARPDRRQARAAVLAVAAAAAAGAVAASLPAVAELTGSAGRRNAEGALLAAAIAVAAAAAAVAQAAFARRETAGRLRAGPLPARVPRALAAGGAVLVVAALVALVAAESGSHGRGPEFGATASRLSSVQSNRYAYWRVAAEAFADHPLAGVGASGFAVQWLERRRIAEGAHDAHSLPLETAAELGLLGLLALGMLVGGTGAAAWRVARDRGPTRPAAGAIGALAAWAAHAAIDWAWELPADTLYALLLAATVIAARDAPRRRERPPAEERVASPAAA